MANLFNSVRGLHPRKNAFNKSYRNTFTTSMGKLVPVYMQDCVPGTTIRCGASGLVRFQALLSPIMDNVNCYVHFWKIPYRLLDPDFPKWIGNELSDEEYDPPYIEGRSLANEVAAYPLKDFDVFGEGGLMDFLGYPSGLSDNGRIRLNVRPLQAYFLLLKHWYTNENFASTKLITAIDDFLDAHGDCVTQLVAVFAALCELGSTDGLFNHAWAKDYFTSALPSVQAGDPVTLGIAGTAPVTIPAQDFAVGPGTGGNIQIAASGSSTTGDKQLYVTNNATSSTMGPLMVGTSTGSSGAKVNRITGKSVGAMKGTADLSEASAVTINELRVANALQVFKERLMRYGHRYVEYLKGFFNVTSSDARMQLPEWLGGGKMPINVADIEQTSATSNSAVSGANTPQGNLAGKGTGFAGGFAGFKTYCEEECIIIGLAYVQPKASYCQGVSRFLTKLNDRYDYFNPSFEHLGEQEIKSQELYVSDETDGSEVFGYTPRYAEYRFHNDETHGQFKSSLNFWTLTRIFASEPALNAQFIYTQPDALRRIFAVQQVDGKYIDNLLCDFHFNVQVVQPVSKYGTPMLLN